ncbi:MAG: hypothetical protein FWD47_09535 [Treponema sp.]|nr:hypothetical protein [Treponema sp.]
MAKYMIYTGGKVYYQEGSSYSDAYAKAVAQSNIDNSFDIATGQNSTGLGMAAANIAIDAVGNAVSKNIDKAMDFTYQGDALFHDGDLDGALKLYDKAIETSLMAAGKALARKGYIYFKQGDNKALECYNKAIKSRAVTKQFTHIYRSELYASIGDTDKAFLDCCDAVNGDYSATYSRYVIRDNASVEVSLDEFVSEYGMDISGFEKRCFTLFKAAAENGNRRAYAGLAECYDQGYGVEKDEQEAMKWFEKAEKAGYINGMHKMKKSPFKIIFFYKLYEKTHIVAAILLALILGIPTFGIGLIPGFIVGWKFGRKIRRKLLPCSSM